MTALDVDRHRGEPASRPGTADRERASRPGPAELLTPIDEFVRRQQAVSAVERYASLHDADTADLGAGRYQALMPASAPGPGQQYRFEVDLDLCTSCKACVSACRSLNGLDDDESWRRVTTLHGLDEQGPTQQAVTSACHHCLDPACLQGCPVDAYSKDERTGIVSHHDDQCIGCSYCVWTCPYEVPRLNTRLGVVRKCDMCAGRLSAGEAPACVQACPNDAIAIGIVDISALREPMGGALVPGLAPSSMTGPSTIYRRSRPLPNTAELAARPTRHSDAEHTPLVVMLVATQTAVGLLLAGAALGLTGRLGSTTRPVLGYTALLLLVGGVATSVAHLGRPTQAWRAVLGVRHSWLSREILSFGALTASVSSMVVAERVSPRLALALLVTSALIGAVAVTTSVQVYAVTGRAWWATERTATAFITTAATAGSSVAALMVAGGPVGHVRLLASATFCLTVAGLGARRTQRLRAERDEVLDRSVRILRDELARLVQVGQLCTIAGGALAQIGVLLLLELGAGPLVRIGVALVAACLVIAGELAERAVFFGAMTAAFRDRGAR